MKKVIFIFTVVFTSIILFFLIKLSLISKDIPLKKGVERMTSTKNKVTTMKGPLKVHPSNPRYFTDETGKVVYLVGSHTWSNFKDMGKTDPPPSFDFDAYLDFLQKYNHNFIRLWTWELSTYTYDGEITYAQPFPWQRTGPGTALDGKPKFDLNQFNQGYFDRLRSRVVSAGERGIYLSIMLFEGHGLHASLEPWCWNGHPFNVNNNVNGIDGDQDGDGRGLETHTLRISEITSLQEAYVRKVIDTVNDLDNVLYEIANESGSYSTEWQYHIIDYIHEYEKDKPKQHPVGMTFQFARAEEHKGTNSALFDSPAEWISPNPEGGYRDNPPAGDGSKVILSDTDHLWGIGGNQAWVWKSFCRGLNPVFMDPYREVQKDKEQEKSQTTWTDHLSDLVTLDPKWEPIRKSMGYTLSYANKMNLVATAPHSELASTKYCIANPGTEYLIYLPNGGSVTVDLSDASGELALEWFNPNTGKKTSEELTAGGSSREFTAPFNGDAVLYIIDKDGEHKSVNKEEKVHFKHVVIDDKAPENPHIKVLGDVNGDGFLDVVVASSNGGPLVWYEYPNWTKHIIVRSGRWSTDAKLVDMDGDGDLDVLISEWYTHNRIEWYENPRPKGDPVADSWKRHVIGSPRAHDIQVGDIDGDGQNEIVTRAQGKEGNKFVIWKQRDDSSWTNRFIDCPSGEGIAIGDVNKDGRLDVVIGGRWYEAPENILQDEWKEHVFADWSPDAVVKVADINKNGRLDVVLTRSEGSYRISWFEAPMNPKRDEWTEHVIDSSIDFAHSLAVCDMDNDGNLDIVTAEMHQSSRKRVIIYFNEGNAINWKRQVIANTGSHNICVGDIGGNGNLDIVGANWSGNYQSVDLFLQMIN